MRTFRTLAAGAALLAAAPAMASLDGHTVDIDHLYPNSGSFYTGVARVVVGPDLEVPDYAGVTSFDLAPTTITIELAAGLQVWPGDGSATSFDGYRFSDALGMIPAIVGVAVGAGTDLPGFGSGRLAFDGDHVFVNLEGLAATDGPRRVVVELLFAPVPEPGSGALWAAGAALVGMAARRRLTSAPRPRA
jgi:hypothetical protein